MATILAVHAALARPSADRRRCEHGDFPPTGAYMLSEVAPLLENFEEPVASLREMEEFAAQFDVHISAHCTDLETMLVYPHVGVVPTLDACGGISGVRRLAQLLGAAGPTRVVALARRERHRLGGDRAPRYVVRELHRPAQSLMDLSGDDVLVASLGTCARAECARRPPRARRGARPWRRSLPAMRYIANGRGAGVPTGVTSRRGTRLVVLSVWCRPRGARGDHAAIRSTEKCHVEQ